MLVTISVTKRDIEMGKQFRLNCAFCPVARAINRRFNRKYRARITQVYLLVFNQHSKKRWCIPLPSKACWFIGNFDAIRPVKPFRFKINISKKYLKERSK